LIIALAGLLLVSGGALAEDGENDGDNDELDVTMAMIPDHTQESDKVTRELTLPTVDEVPIVPQTAVDNSKAGLDAANAARVDGKAFGQEARNLAEDNRERFGRGGGAPELDDLIPDGIPGAPDLPPVAPPTPPTE
jgi:hypothetical protein